MAILRDYQVQACECAWRSLERHRSTLLVMATGLGKTVVFSEIANQATQRMPDKDVLILAHRVELLDQAAMKYEAHTGKRAFIEQQDRKIAWRPPGGNCHIASVATLTPDRLSRREDVFSPDRYGLIIIDEAHHSTAATYLHLLAYFGAGEFIQTHSGRRKFRIRKWDGTGPRVLGVTATPKRADGMAMGNVYEDDCCHFSMDVLDGIAGGYLVPVHQQLVEIGGLDLSSIDGHNGDFKDEDLERLMIEEKPLHQVAKPILDLPEDWQGIIFTPGVTFAHELASVINRHKGERAAIAIDGTTPSRVRQARVDGFRSGQYRMLVNFGVATEGFDHDGVHFVAMARLTKSLSLYMQMLGRGTRPLANVIDGLRTVDARREAIQASSKPKVLVLDYVGNSKHRIMSCVDALGGKFGREIVERASKGGGGTGNVQEMLEQARAELISEKVYAIRQKFMPKFTYQLRDIDITTGMTGDAPRAQIASRRGGATDKQVEVLMKFGVDREEALRMSRGRAGHEIDRLRSERPTIKQAEILRRFGHPTNISFYEARSVLDAIFARDKIGR